MIIYVRVNVFNIKKQTFSNRLFLSMTNKHDPTIYIDVCVYVCVCVCVLHRKSYNYLTVWKKEVTETHQKVNG